MIAFAAGAMAFFLGQMAIILAFIPSPVIIVFAVLALPLRKDQPMETYLAALIKFYFSPHVRLWDPDGQDSLIEISNPIVDDEPRIKEFGGEEAARRLSFLADVSDTQGWATRGVGAPINTTILADDLAAEASTTVDILEGADSLSQSIDNMLSQSNQQVRQAAVIRMQNDAPSPSVPQMAVPSTSSTPVATSEPAVVPTPPAAPVTASPYASVQAMAVSQPTSNISEVDEASAEALLKQAAAGMPVSNQPSMQQRVIQPLGGVFGSSSHSTPTPSSTSPVPPRQPAVPVIPTAIEPEEPTPLPLSPVEAESATIESASAPEDEGIIDLGGDDGNNETTVSLH